VANISCPPRSQTNGELGKGVGGFTEKAEGAISQGRPAMLKKSGQPLAIQTTTAETEMFGVITYANDGER